MGRAGISSDLPFWACDAFGAALKKDSAGRGTGSVRAALLGAGCCCSLGFAASTASLAASDGASLFLRPVVGAVAAAVVDSRGLRGLRIFGASVAAAAGSALALLGFRPGFLRAGAGAGADGEAAAAGVEFGSRS